LKYTGPWKLPPNPGAGGGATGIGAITVGTIAGGATGTGAITVGATDGGGGSGATVTDGALVVTVVVVDWVTEVV